MAKDQLMDASKVVVIGGSAGSIDALMKLFPLLQKPIGFTLIIVLHRKNSVDSSLADLFSMKTSIPVSEVEDKDPIQSGKIYVAPADYHLLVEEENIFALDASEKINYSRPSLDVTYESVAEVFGPSAIGILLSGANADGTDGLRIIKKAGGLTIVQDPATAQTPFMPHHALQHVQIDFVFSVEEIARFLNHLS
ncbi:chemotaxis protein CheB [Siphonobacter sp. SORGH_AS_0500]|uniref:chemotaxis protein CheB n=1 Tax=Siphonobacter sp. SORGH_AS_0500 TaxID=1864824 RepID=UPI002862F1A9|nr:chemotaxis protein CheB [Siphonobacter sp. SORGH_AS_0500]MDR6194859.1 two-component system chemotaxis response regulator CheB [Siphonobacter sp. SORGH_AS_0500]